MPDHTAEFLDIVHRQVPQKKQRRDNGYDVFTKEAYRINEHIVSLKRFLLTIRRAYLSTSESRPRFTPPKKKSSSDSASSLFALFPTDIESLTDTERDEIDFQAKVIIRRCMDRIKELEHAEQIRKEQQPKGFAQIFHSFIAQKVEDTLALHRSSITWLLNKRLAEVSELQKNQQEIRLTRELEKSENQLHRARTVEQDVMMPAYKFTTDEDDDNSQDFQTDDLSPEQVQMLEKENSTMIEELNNTLNQVRNAEKALLEISTLQTQLTSHLAAQTAQTDRLYADSIASTERIEQGNLQLIKTRERNRGTRHFTLFFLLMASFVLLFLDWYA